MNDTKSARRYARALIETATNTLAVRDELVEVVSTLKASPGLVAALSNPGVPAPNKKAILSAVFLNLSAPLPRLFEMLIDASRIELIHEITHFYREEWNARNNVHVARVITATPLDDDAIQRVRKAIESSVSGSVELDMSTDPSLVGGLKVEVDGHLFDGTVKARLNALRRHLS